MRILCVKIATENHECHPQPLEWPAGPSVRQLFGNLKPASRRCAIISDDRSHCAPTRRNPNKRSRTAQNPWEELCAARRPARLTGPAAKRKTLRLLPPQPVVRRYEKRRFRGTTSAKLQGFALVRKISASFRNCNLLRFNTLQQATSKTQMQNALIPEVYNILPHALRNNGAKLVRGPS